MKKQAFLKNVTVAILFSVFVMSCNERAVESMQELKYHTHVFGVFQLKEGDFLVTAVKVNIDAVCKNHCEHTSASTFRDICLIRTDSTGTVIWEKIFQEQGDEGDFSAIITTDDYLLISGNTGKDDFINNGFTTNGFVAKFTLNGNLLWRKTMEPSRTQHFNAFSTSKEGDIAKSIFKFDQNSYTYGVVVLDKNGNRKWQYIRDSKNVNFMEAVFLNNDELLILRAKDNDAVNTNERILEKFNRNGWLIWSRPLTVPVENLAKASDNGFWAIGKEGWLGRFTNNGEVMWSKNLTLPKGRIIYFESNTSGKLILELLAGNYFPEKRQYFLINDREEIEIENSLPNKEEYPIGTTIETAFVHVLADKNSLVVEMEAKFILGNTFPEGYQDCRLVLSKFNLQGMRLWKTIVGKGKKSVMLPLLMDF